MAFDARQRRQGYARFQRHEGAAQEVTAAAQGGDEVRVSVQVGGQRVEVTVGPSRAAAVAPAVGSRALVNRGAAKVKPGVASVEPRTEELLAQPPTASGAVKLPGQPTRETRERVYGTYTPVAAVLGERMVDRVLVPHVKAMGSVSDEDLRTSPELHPSRTAQGVLRGVHEVLWFGEARGYFVGYQIDQEKLMSGEPLTLRNNERPDGVYVVEGLAEDTEDGLGFVRVPYDITTGEEQHRVGEEEYSDLLPGALPVFGHVDITGQGKWTGPEFVPATVNWHTRLEQVQAIAQAAPVGR